MREQPIIRKWLTCDCGKKHMAAYASEASKCSCGRRLGARLWQDNLPQNPPERVEETP